MLALFITVVVAQGLVGDSRAGLIALAAIIGSIAAVVSLQYHCLDCGATDSYHRWRRHACHRVVERWRTPYSAASRFFPTPGTQLVFWLLAIIIGFFLWVLTGL